MTYFCCDEQRRTAVKDHPVLNGIDFLEVVDDQTTLQVHFLKELAPGSLDISNVIIEGGERITNIVITGVSIGTLSSPPSPPASPLSPPSGDNKILVVKVKEAGDFS